MAQNLPDSPQSPRFSKESSEARKNHGTKETPAQKSISSAKAAWGRQSFEPLNESSPLLSPEQDEFQDGLTSSIPGTPSGMLDWGEEDEEESKSVWYLFVLTLSIGG